MTYHMAARRWHSESFTADLAVLAASWQEGSRSNKMFCRNVATERYAMKTNILRLISGMFVSLFRICDAMTFIR